MKTQTYTIGEITRLGLLVNHKGEPYKHRGTVSKVLASVQHEVVKTAYGKAKMFSQRDIDRLNRRWN